MTDRIGGSGGAFEDTDEDGTAELQDQHADFQGGDARDVGQMDADAVRSGTPPLTARERSLSNGTDVGNLSFGIQNVWHDVLPEPTGGALENVIPIHRSVFVGDPFGAETNYFGSLMLAGSEASKSVAGGTLTVTNNTGAKSQEWLTRRGDLAGPNFAVMLRVDDIDSGSSGTRNPWVGVLDDANNQIQCMFNPQGPQVEVYRQLSGNGGQQILESDPGISAPYHLLAMFLGNEVHVLTHQGDGWTHHGVDSWPTSDADFYQKSTLEAFNVGFGYNLSDTNSVTVDDFRAFHSAQFGIRDLSAITYRNGHPLIRDNRVYLSATGGGSTQGTNVQTVVSMDLTTYEFDVEAVLFSDSGNGEVHSDCAGKIVYDEDAGSYQVWFSGWSHSHNGADADAKLYFAETSSDVLHGVHRLQTEKVTVPNQAGTRVYDPFIIHDESAGAWRLVYNYDAGEFRMSELGEGADDLASGWTEIATVVANGGAEGPKIARVNGSEAVTWADTDQTSGMAHASYPDLTGEANLSVDVTTGSESDGGWNPHPMIVPVPDGDRTRYLLITFDNLNSYGLSQPYGAAWVYEAAETADGYEYEQLTK